MDLRSLLLARTHTVVLDPDSVAAAATRPTRDVDLERFEDELAQLGFVMSLDLAMTLRRLPHQAIAQLRTWMLVTLGVRPGEPAPTVPLSAAPPTASRYLQRITTWLVAQPLQPCPWCAQVKAVLPLEPCGHLVCRDCWDAGSFVGCAVCHRRAAPADRTTWAHGPTVPITHAPPDARLRLVFLGFDLVGAARARFETLVGGDRRMTPVERADLEAIIDSVGPKAAPWLPRRIPIAENRATAIARLWVIAPDRDAMMQQTSARITTATDVLRIAVVLLGGDASLARIRTRSIPRSLRRAVLGALDRLPRAELEITARDRASLWKRLGERLHPTELAARYPEAARVFAIARGEVPGVAPRNAGLEDALRRRDVRGAIEQVAHPDALLRRFAAIARRATNEPSPLLYAATTVAIGRASSRALFAFATHLRDDPRRASLREATLAELVRRAGTTRMFPRAAIARALGGYVVARAHRVTWWDVAAVHAAARGNVVYVREAHDWTMYRRHDGEPGVQRLARLFAGECDGRVAAIPTADAPTWFALLADDVALPEDSVGFYCDREAARFATELVTELPAK